MTRTKKWVLVVLALGLLSSPSLQAAGTWGKKAESSSAGKKKAAAVEEEVDPAEEALGPELAKLLHKAEEISEDAAELQEAMAKRPKGSSRTRFLDDLKDLRERARKVLDSAREAKVKAGAELKRDVFLVQMAQGLRALELVAQGIADDDDDTIEKGWALGALVQADMAGQAVASPAGGSAAGPGPGGIGPSMGINLSLQSQSGGMNMNTDLSSSFPISRAMDLGLGFSMTLNSSSSSSTSSSVNLNMGLNTFMRYHYLDAFPASPWLVPYVGLKIGYDLGMTSSVGSGTAGSSDSSGMNGALQLGMLMFLDRKQAVTLQVESTGRSSTSVAADGSESVSSSSGAGLTLGLRRMF